MRHHNALKKLFGALFAALALGATPQTGAHATWPTHTITMVVLFPQGGLADIVARPVAEAMARKLGQPVVIENKAGAGGTIGMAQVAKSKPDGFAVLLGGQIEAVSSGPAKEAVALLALLASASSLALRRECGFEER